jgi:hypothetical protein
MDKRYQVFISSTFLDLQDERQAVLKAILEIDHMPAGMELFPATDDTAWGLIQDVIDSSDYYILIVGGRYGSRDDAGLSYTEKEYDHAVAAKKPVIALLHRNPETLPRQKTESDTESWDRLKRFRAKVEKGHTCVYWQNADDLKAKVIVGLTAATKRHPAVGWIRADKAPTEATLVEVLALKSRITELEAEAAAARDSPPPGTGLLAQGEDRFELGVEFVSRERLAGYPFHEDTAYTANVKLSWNAIFAAVAPSMINEAADSALHRTFREFLLREARRRFEHRKEFADRELRDFSFRKDEIETCIVQLRALGLIRESDKKRSVKDMGTYWSLTPYGNTLMVQLRAIRREPIETSVEEDGATPQRSDEKEG